MGVTLVSASAMAAIKASKVRVGAFRGSALIWRKAGGSKIGTVGGEITQLSAGGFDEVSDTGHFVVGEIVEG